MNTRTDDMKSMSSLIIEQSSLYNGHHTAKLPIAGHTRFEVSMLVKFHIMVVWVMIPCCSWVPICQNKM